jgi:hypothetical protein
MKKVIAVFLSSILFASLSLGQEDENWLKGFGTEADHLPTLLYWEPKRFSLEDLPNGKRRLDIIRQYTARNEWEGLYYANTAIGDNKFIWNTEGGFFSFYFYHTLKSLSFGTVKESSGFVELDYEKPPYSQKTKKSKTRLVKVAIDETHFLVPENRLRDFCGRAAGLETDLSDIGYYWIKEDDMEKLRDGLPVLPPEYKNFLRYPIKARIKTLGKREIIRNEQSTAEHNFDDIHYFVVLDAGSDARLRKDMNLFVRELGEWILLTRVSKTSSIGFVRRDIGEKGHEQCRDSQGGSGQLIPCRRIKVGMVAKTRGDL